MSRNGPGRREGLLGRRADPETEVVYYHCSGFRGKCPEKYVREEVLEGLFTELLGQLTFGQDIMDWLVRALRESHADEKKFHEEAIAGLQSEYTRIQTALIALACLAALAGAGCQARRTTTHPGLAPGRKHVLAFDPKVAR